MADPTPQDIARSARGHVALYEEQAARRQQDLATGNHQIDEATTRAWLALDEDQLTIWRRALSSAEFALKQVD